MTFSVKLFNIPVTKTEENLLEEFKHIDVVYSSVRLPLTSDNLNVGYAIVEFETQDDLTTFCTHFHVMRKNLVIYKEHLDDN
jgi:RNA recognition motif-containing protein